MLLWRGLPSNRSENSVHCSAPAIEVFAESKAYEPNEAFGSRSMGSYAPIYDFRFTLRSTAVFAAKSIATI